jgi:hypothetical protein
MKAPGFNPRTYQVISRFQAFAFKCNLHRSSMAPASSAQLASYFAAGAGVGTVAIGAVYGGLSLRQQRLLTCATLVGLYMLNPPVQ